jgi:hypothetical protein
MSYSKSCNVDVVKTFDLRARAQGNFSPGLYSTLAAGPQEVYGSPLNWEYILLLSDVQNIKNIHSTLISSSFSSLSANILYVSSYLDYNVRLVSTTLLTQYQKVDNSNVYLTGTLIYDVSNFYTVVNNTLKYPYTLSTIVKNYSTVSTYLKTLEPTLTTFSTNSTLFYYGNSTIVTLNTFISPSISTIISELPVYSNLLPFYLSNEVSNVNSTVITSVCNYLANQSTIFNITFSTLQTISTFLLNTYSTQFQTYSTINDAFYNQQLGITQQQFSSFSTVLGQEFESVDYLFNTMLSTISVANWSITSNISTSFQPLISSTVNTYSTLISTISTDQGSQDINNNVLSNIFGYDNFINSLSSGVGQLYFYSTITRPQVYYTMNFLFNDKPISTFYYTSTLGQDDLSINYALAYNLLQDQISINTPALSALFASNIYNSYYNIIKAYRSNGIPLIDTLCNIVFQPDFVSTFGHPANVSTAFAQYSTQVNSSILHSYKIVLQSERQSIQNTKVIFTTLSTNYQAISTIVTNAITSLSNEMRVSTLTTFNNLLNNTFRNYRSNSELTTQILNSAEASNYVVMCNSFTTIRDHTLQDALYRDISTLYAYNFLTTKDILTSTSFGLLNLDPTTQITYSTISSLSTFYFTSISSFQSSILGLTFSSLFSSYQNTSGFNDSTISTQLSYLDPVASSIALYFSGDLFSTLSTNIYDRNETLSNFILNTQSVLQGKTTNLSNAVDTLIFGQSNGLINKIGDCNTTVSQFFSTIFSNSISLYSDQVILSSFTTLSSIYFKAPLRTFEAGANATKSLISPLQITHFDGKGTHNVLFINSTFNEVIANSVKISGLLSTILINTVSTINLDLNQYQNFLVDIRTMSNANPTMEINVNLSTVSKHTQEGNINITISPASANEIAAGRFLNILNLGPTIRLNITKLYGFLKYKYLAINNKTFVSQANSYTKTTSSVLAAGNVTTLTQVLSSDFIGIVNDSFDNLFITNNSTNSIFKYNYITGELTEFARGINIPYNLAIDSTNTLYTVSFADNHIFKISPDGTIRRLELLDSNDGSNFVIQSPVGIAVDKTGTYLYVSSLVTCAIYQINLATLATSILVGEEPGYLDGVGLAARFGLIFGMTIDTDGTLYVADFANNSIRRIVINTKTVITVFGPLPTDGTAGTAGNSIIYASGIPTNNPEAPEPGGNDARFSKPTGLVADNLGNLFVCDSGNFAIRRLNINTTQVITISGKQNGGFSDGAISSAGYTRLQGITINNGKTNFFACDFSRIRQVGYNINAITGNSAAQLVQNTLVEAATRYAVTLYGPLPYIYDQPTYFRGIAVGDNLNCVKNTYTLTSATASATAGGIITFMTSAPNDLVSGQFVSITDFTSSQFNIKGIITVKNSTQFTIRSSFSSGNATGTGTATTYFPLVFMQTYRDIASNQCKIYQFDVENEVFSSFVSIPSVIGLGMCIDPNTNILYTINQTTGTPATITSLVYKITPDGTVSSVASFFNNTLQSITISSDGTILFVSDANRIYQIDLSSSYSAVFVSTQSDQTWTCPAGITSLNVTLLGGASGCFGDIIYSGTSGGFVSGTLTVTPGTVYKIIVGQGGFNSGGWWTSQGQGGYGGGGSGTGGQYGPSGGGGRSAIQVDGTGIDLVTAGGAAGSYYYGAGGVGGDPNGGGQGTGVYQGQSGYNGGGGGGNPGGTVGKGGKSFTDNLTNAVSIPGGARNAYHLNGGQTSDGLIIMNSADGLTVIAGSGTTGSLDGIGTDANINALTGMSYDSSNIYFTDTNCVRKLVLSSKNVTTIAGDPYTNGSADGIGRAAQFYAPTDLKTDLNGTLYIADQGNNAVRKIDIQSRIVTTLAGSMGNNLYPPNTNPDGFLNQALLFQPTKITFDHPFSNTPTGKDLYILDNNGLLLRGLYASYINASYPMSTIISFDSALISQYSLTMSTVTQGINSYVTNTALQSVNTLNSYNNTLAAPNSAQKGTFLQTASNAVLDVSSLYISSQIASSIASYDYLSLVTISTLASPQYLSSSYVANVYLSTASNLLYDGQFQSSNVINLNQAAKIDANNAANAVIAANVAGTTTNIKKTYNWNGFDQVFTVPANVNKITVELIGGGGYGTYGGYVLGELSTSPGTQYTIIVGIGAGNGGIGYPQIGGAGLTSGGGGIGGGRSAIQLYGTGVDIATAGGGGGITAFNQSAPNGYYFPGGNGGGLIGQAAPSGAGGGTQFAGGAASGYGASAGSYQQGGFGIGGGGGGGGGYYGGGGGGGFNQGAGGGSSYVANLTGTVINLQGGAQQQSGDGQVSISYSLQTAPTGSFSPVSLSNCTFWFDAADQATIIGGTNLSSWGNKGATGGYANTSAGNPVNGVSNINGLNSIYFPPYSVMGFQSALGDGNITFFMVTAVGDLTANGSSYSQLFGSKNTVFSFQEIIVYNGNYILLPTAYNSANFFQAPLYQNPPYTNLPNISPAPLPNPFGNYQAVSLTQSSGGLGPAINKTYLDGNFITGSVANLQAGYLVQSDFFEINDPSTGLSQNIGEIIVYNRVLTEIEITQVNTYLMNKWGTQPYPVTLLAGSYAGLQDGTGAAAAFQYQAGIATLNDGNLVVVDQGNNSIRVVTYPSGVVTTLAGQQQSGSTDGTGTGALFSAPNSAVVFPDNNILVSDILNNGLRLVRYPSGVVTLYAGIGGTIPGNTLARTNIEADGQFNQPYGLATFNIGGQQYIAVCDYGNNQIRILTYTDDGSFSDTDTILISINNPQGIAYLQDGNFAVVCGSDSKVYLLTVTYSPYIGFSGAAYDPYPISATSTVLAGSTEGFADGNDISAMFRNPFGIYALPTGNLIVNDTDNNRVRHITYPAAVVTTIAGNGTRSLVNGIGAANSAFSGNVTATSINGDIIISDCLNSAIRVISGFPMYIYDSANFIIYGNSITSLSAYAHLYSVKKTPYFVASCVINSLPTGYVYFGVSFSPNSESFDVNSNPYSFLGYGFLIINNYVYIISNGSDAFLNGAFNIGNTLQILADGVNIFFYVVDNITGNNSFGSGYTLIGSLPYLQYNYAVDLWFQNSGDILDNVIFTPLNYAQPGTPTLNDPTIYTPGEYYTAYQPNKLTMSWSAPTVGSADGYIVHIYENGSLIDTLALGNVLTTAYDLFNQSVYTYDVTATVGGLQGTPTAQSNPITNKYVTDNVIYTADITSSFSQISPRDIGSIPISAAISDDYYSSPVSLSLIANAAGVEMYDIRIFGLSYSANSWIGFYPDYCFEINGSAISVIERGVVVYGPLSTFVPNDLFVVQYDGTYMSYYQNGSLLYQSTFTPTGPFFAEMEFYEPYQPVSGVIFENALYYPPLPDPPTLTDPPTIAGTTLTMSWTAPIGSVVTGYTLKVYENDGNPTIYELGNVLTYNYTGLNYTSYYYNFSVAAKNNTGSSAFTSKSSNVTFGLPDSPTNPIGVLQNDAFVMSWTAPTTGLNVDGYTITLYRNDTPIAGLSSLVLTASTTLITYGNTYKFSVAATNGAGASSYTSTSIPVNYIYVLNNVTQTDTANETFSMTAGGGNDQYQAEAYSTTAFSSPVSLAVVLPADSSVTYDHRVFGLSLTPAANIYDMPTFCIEVRPAIIYVYENGAYVFYSTSSFSPGDLFVVQYNGTKMQYYQNGTLLYESTNTFSDVLYADMAFVEQNQPISDIIFNNDLYYPSSPNAPTLNDPTIQSTGLVMTWSAPTTGTVPTGYVVRIYKDASLVDTQTLGDVLTTTYSSLTDGGSYTFDVAGKINSATGTATAQSNPITYNYTLINMTQTIDSIASFTTASGSYNTHILAQAYSITGYTNPVSLAFAFNDSSLVPYDVKYVGLSLTPSTEFSSPDYPTYCFQIEFSNFFSIIDNGSFFLTNTACNPGDLFVVQYDGTNMNYYQNGTMVYQSTPPTGETYYADIQNWDQSQTFTGVIFENTLYYDTTPPNVPTLNDPTIQDTALTMTWSAPVTGISPTGYVVRIYKDASLVDTQTLGNVLTTTYSSLTAGGSYTFDVAATNSNGTGTATAQSNPITYSYTLINMTQTIDSIASFTTASGSHNGYILAQAYSITGYTNPVSLAFAFNDSSSVVYDTKYVGLSLTPSTEFSSYDYPTYCFQIDLSYIFSIIDNTSVFLANTACNPGDLFVIEYDGTNMNYYQNGTMIYQSTPPTGETYYADIQNYDQSQTFTGVSFTDSIYYPAPPDIPTLNDPILQDGSLVMTWSAPITGTTPTGYIVRIYENTTLVETQTLGNVLTTSYSSLNTAGSYTFDVTAKANGTTGTATAQSNSITYNYMLTNVTQIIDPTISVYQEAKFIQTNGTYDATILGQAYSLTGFLAPVSVVGVASSGGSYDYRNIGLSLDPTIEFSGQWFPYNTFELANGSYHIIESGDQVYGPVSYSVNDEFVVQYDGTNMQYYQNGSLVYQSTPATGNTYYADTQFYDQNQTLTGVIFQNSLYYFPTPDIPTLNDPTIQDGLLVMSWAAPTTGTTPMAYTVIIYASNPNDVITQNLGNVLTSTFDGMVAGSVYTYTVTALALGTIGTPQESAPSNPITYNYTLTDVTQTIDSTAIFSQTSAGINVVNGQAYSIFGYQAPVSLAVIIPYSDYAYYNIKTFGLSVGPSISDLDSTLPNFYCIRITTYDIILIFEDSTIANFPSSTFTPNDLFVVQYDGTNMSYYQNGTLLFQSQPPANQTYYANMIFTEPNQPLNGVVFENSLYYVPPDVPILNDPTIQDTALTMTWTAPTTGTTPTGYIVKIYENSTLVDTQTLGNVLTTSYSSLNNFASYSYTVTSVASGIYSSESVPSNPITYNYTLYGVQQNILNGFTSVGNGYAKGMTGYTYPFTLSFTNIALTGTIDFVGISRTPETDNIFYDTPFRIQVYASTFDAITPAGFGGTSYTIGDLFTIVYDGTNFAYAVNGFPVTVSSLTDVNNAISPLPTIVPSDLWYPEIWFDPGYSKPNDAITGFSFIDSAVSLPAAPTVNDPTISGTTLNVSWTAGTGGGTNYGYLVNIYNGVTPVTGSPFQFATSITSTTYTLQVADEGGVFTFNVQAGNQAGFATSTTSNPITYSYTLINMTQTIDSIASFTTASGSYNVPYIVAQAYSITGYTNPVSLAFTFNDSSSVSYDIRYIGLSLTPSTELSSQDYPKYFFLINTSYLFSILDNSSEFVPDTACNPGDLFVIQYDGTNMNYYQNGTMVYQSTPPTGETYYADIQNFDQSQTFTGVIFENSLYYPPPPDAPTLNDPTIQDTALTMTWTAPTTGTTPTGYIVRIYENTTLVDTQTLGDVLTLTYSSLTAGSTYTFDVAATNSNGTGTATAQSNPITYSYVLINMTQTIDSTRSFTPISGPDTSTIISQAYSITGFSTYALIEATVPDSTHLYYDYIVMGLSISPSTELPNASPDYEIQVYPTDLIFIVIDNYNSAFTGTFTPGDDFTIEYDGTYINYYHLGALIYQNVPPNGQVYYADIQFWEPGQSCTNVVFTGY